MKTYLEYLETEIELITAMINDPDNNYRIDDLKHDLEITLRAIKEIQ